MTAQDAGPTAVVEDSAPVDQRARLEAYLALIGLERRCRPAEAMLADEIHRLRLLIASCHDVLADAVTPWCERCRAQLLTELAAVVDGTEAVGG